MKLDRKVFTILMVGMLLMVACNLTAGSPTNNTGAEATLAALAVQATIDAGIRQTADAGGSSSGGDSSSSGGDSSGGDSSAPTQTLAPSNTPEPTFTFTPSVPEVSVSVDTNCRKGPTPQFDYLGALLVGEKTTVLGRLSNSQWVFVRNPDGGPDCWLWAQYASFTTDINPLPVFTPPPTPTPTFTPTPIVWFHGSWNVRIDGFPFSMSVTQSGTSISGYADTGGGNSATFTGTASGPELKYVSGTWTSTIGTSGTFEWQLRTNTNQFNGNIVKLLPLPVENGAFCGWRSGASEPSPCLGP
jgi:hypothetical protein